MERSLSVCLENRLENKAGNQRLENYNQVREEGSGMEIYGVKEMSVELYLLHAKC